MKVSFLSLLTSFLLAIPLEPLLSILQQARGKAVAHALLSPTQPVNQDCCLKDTNVELVLFTVGLHAHITHHFVQCKGILLESSF